MDKDLLGSGQGQPPPAQPVSRTARQARILEILSQYRVSSQVQLSELLLDDGIDITQATLSCDLDELGAKKVRPESGRAYYTVGPGDSVLLETTQ